MPQLMFVPPTQEQSPHPSPMLNTVTISQKQIAQRPQVVHGSAANVHSLQDAHPLQRPQILTVKQFQIDVSLMEHTVLK
jgi:hypothetical protein